ncbi:MAG TPA: hypothetical protein VEV45_07815 [Streptosporangiaceae bacterium]|nr:hypothetical protein [Streptosporangiaceae bacterium]
MTSGRTSLSGLRAPSQQAHRLITIDAGYRMATRPVFTDQGVEDVRRQIDAYGWHAADLVLHWSRAQILTAQTKAEGTVQA